jgi:hypothetical protein
MPTDNPLDLTKGEQRRLYFSNRWPDEFLDRLVDAVEQTPEYAQVVADRIDFFIETNGTDKVDEGEEDEDSPEDL